jgi:hypothetical protein
LLDDIALEGLTRVHQFQDPLGLGNFIGINTRDIDSVFAASRDDTQDVPCPVQGTQEMILTGEVARV